MRPHKAHGDYEGGFTLIEILVVLTIIALMASVVVLSIPTPKSVLEKQASILTVQLNSLAQDGLISGQVTAAGFSQMGYTLYSFERGEWVERYEDQWHDRYRLQFTRMDTKIDLPEDVSPNIIFQPTGSSTPFEFKLSDITAQYVLSTKGDGRVTLGKSLR